MQIGTREGLPEPIKDVKSRDVRDLQQPSSLLRLRAWWLKQAATEGCRWWSKGGLWQGTGHDSPKAPRGGREGGEKGRKPM